MSLTLVWIYGFSLEIFKIVPVLSYYAWLNLKLEIVILKKFNFGIGIIFVYVWISRILIFSMNFYRKTSLYPSKNF